MCNRRGARLHSDDLDAGADRLGRDAGSRRTAPAADRDKDYVDVGPLLEDFKGVRGHSRDEVGFVARMDIAVTMLGGQLLAVEPRVVEVVSDENNFSAEVTHRLDFDRVGAFRSADDRADAEELRGERHGLAVVAGRSADNASRPGRGIEL